MCILVDKCCFCIDLEAATRGIALAEAVLAIPCLIQGVASLSVLNLAAGLLLFVSAWVLFDGAFLRRKALLMGWLVSTVVKIFVCACLGVLFSYLLGEKETVEANKGSFLYPLKKLGESYISCLLNWTEQETLFFVVYAVTFFSCAFIYTYFFAIVFSYREKVKSIEQHDKEKRRRARKQHHSRSGYKSKYDQTLDLEYYL